MKLGQWFWRRWFFKSVDVFSQFHYYIPFEKAESFIWTNLNFLHSKGIFEFGWNLPSGSGEEGFKDSSIYFSYFVIIFIWKGGGALHLYKLETPSHYDALCPVEIGPVFLEKMIFQNRPCKFRNFVIISSWKRTEPFNWTNLNPLRLRMLCANCRWNGSSGSGDVF